jgi:hypothetical protein
MKSVNGIRVLGSLATLCVSFGLLACAPQNPPLDHRKPFVPEQEAKNIPDAKPIETQGDNTPKADILFVIDHSASMGAHQARLRANIDRFVKEFDQDGVVDLNIGVVTVWDSERFGPDKPNFYEQGRLRTLKNPATPDAETSAGPQVLKRGPGYRDILAETLKVGVLHLKDGGPEKEETLSPIKAALTSTHENNKGFFRRDAHLAVIIVSDADDASITLTPKSLFDELIGMKGGDRAMISAYGILSIGDKCARDPDLVDKKTRKKLQPVQVQTFVGLAGGKIFDICDDDGFGENLAEVASNIQKSASSRVRVTLPAVPERNSLRVRYEGAAQDLRIGIDYTYDPRANAIVLTARPASKDGRAQAKLLIDLKPIDFRKAVRGRVRTRGYQQK